MSEEEAWAVWGELKKGHVPEPTGVFGNNGSGNLEKIWLGAENKKFECGIYINRNPDESKEDERLPQYPNDTFTGMYLQDAVAMLN